MEKFQVLANKVKKTSPMKRSHQPLRLANRPFLLLLPLFLSILAASTAVLASKVPSSVIELNDKFLDVMSEGMWFVSFYAPWCAHCKRLSPVWEQMAHALADANSPVRVGRLDCTRYSSVASKLSIHGYPTLLFFRQGKRIPYEGERRREALVKFAEKTSGPVVQRLEDVEGAKRLETMRRTSDKEPFFLMATTGIDGHSEEELAFYAEFQKIAEELFTEVSFYGAHVDLLPFDVEGEVNVLVFKDNTHYSFPFPPHLVHGVKGASATIRQNLSEWIQAERWPLLPHITPSNIREMALSTGKKLVMGVVDGVNRTNTSTESGRFFKTLAGAAKAAREDEELWESFQFGWTDELQMVHSISMSYLTVPNLLVFNYSSYEFYTSEDAPNAMTPQSIQLWLSRLAAGSIAAKGGRSWPTRLRRMCFEVVYNLLDMFHSQPILTTCLFGVPLAFFAIIVYTLCSSDFAVDREEIYPRRRGRGRRHRGGEGSDEAEEPLCNDEEEEEEWGEDGEGEEEDGEGEYSDYEGVEMEEAEQAAVSLGNEKRAPMTNDEGGHSKTE